MLSLDRRGKRDTQMFNTASKGLWETRQIYIFDTKARMREMSHKKEGEHKLFSHGIYLHASLTWRIRYDLQDITLDLVLLEMSP